MNAPGTKKNSLTTLERRLNKQSRRRAAATSGSLGGGSMVAGSSADVERLIAIVKGKPRGSELRGLAKLEQSGAQLPDKPQQVIARAYDVGAPIRGRGMQPATPAVSGALAARHWFLPDDRENSASSFAVELFDEVSLPSTNLSAEEGLSTGPTAELTIADTGAAPASSAPTFTVSGERDVESRLTLAASTARETPLGLDLAATAEAGRSDDADQFEKEVQAILSGMKKRPPAPPENKPPPAEPLAAAQSEAPPPARPHDVFERLGQNMPFANAFHLPAVELSKRLDALEVEVATEEDADARRSDAAALDLTDDDIAASLGLALDSKVELPVKAAPLLAKLGGDTPTLDLKPVCVVQPPPELQPAPQPGAAAPIVPAPPLPLASAPATPSPVLAAQPTQSPPPAAGGNAAIHNPLIPAGATP